jgi:hypothetical protein
MKLHPSPVLPVDIMRLTEWLQPAGNDPRTEVSEELPAYRCTVAGTVYAFHVLPYYPDVNTRHRNGKRTSEV